MPDTTRPETFSLANEGFTKVERKDYFGNPYTAWVRNEKPNLGKIWSKFRDRLNQEDTEQRKAYSIIQADTDLTDESQQLDNDNWNEKIEQYFEQQLLEDK